MSSDDPTPTPDRQKAWEARLACAAVFAASLLAILPTLGDLGLTYDEPAYRYSQILSGQWWERLARARTAAELADVMAPDTLLYYWPYARHGINFHPPLAGQLNLLTWELTSGWLKDIPARRLSTSLLYALAITCLFGFLRRRYCAWTGLAAAGALLTMPRVYGQAHLIDTDTPGMVLWLLTAICFWKGVYEPNGRPWRIAVGILTGLAFVQKLGAVFVLVPLLAWLAIGHLPRALWKRQDSRAWLDGMFMTALLAAPLALAYAEIRRLETKLPRPQFTRLLVHDPPSWLPGAVLLTGLAVWLLRRWLARRNPQSRLWGVERPALETWCAILAFGPALAWLGNPAWWRHAMTRLAHYYQLSTARKGALPDIQNYYFGRIYEYSLPWHSAWVLIGITVPATLLAAAAVGLLWSACRVLLKRDRLPLFFLLLFVTLPMLRVMEAPAHDGVRLILPCFPFLAAFAAWGTAWLGETVSKLIPVARRFWLRALVTATILIPATWQLVKVHPYELSYYNELIGGPEGAWETGFELSYWYDAFTPEVLADLNARIPLNASISYANEQSNPVMVLQDLQALGELRGDLKLWDPADGDRFPSMWLLTHDSKASSFTRLLFAMKPWYASTPRQLDGLRVLTVADPAAVSRAWALQLLCHGPAAEPEIRPLQAPQWVREWAPPLARLWGDGLTQVKSPQATQTVITWAEDDPEGLRQAARWIADGKPAAENPAASRLLNILTRDDRPASGQNFSGLLLRARPEALYEAALILIARGEAVARVLEYPGYRDPAVVGGFLDEGVGLK